MTRKKKSRSLKRIHNVKTGNISKLKKANATDRQSTRLKNRAKPKSVYQKFLEENPEVAEQENKKALQAQQVSETKAEQEDKAEEPVKESKEREPDLLSQLDDKSFDDLY